MRRGIVGILILVAATSIYAAGSGEETGTAVQTEIVFQHWMTELKPIFDPEIERFEAANPGISVQQEILPYGDYWNKLPIAMAGGEGPDLYAMTRPDFEPFAAAGRTTDIEAAIEASPAMMASMGALDEEVIDAYRYDGVLMGIPFTVESSAIYFNKTMFEEAGLPLLTEIEDTWTWDDMREIAIDLTKVENGRTVQYGMHVTPNRLPVFDFIWSNGGEIYSDDGKTILAGSPQALQAMEYLTSLIVDDGVSPDYSFSKTVGSWEQFMSGSIGMIAGGPAVMSRLREITDFEWDVAEFPRSPYSGSRMVASNVLGFIVGPNSDAIPETVELIAALTAEGPMTEMANIGANIPARRDSRAPYFSESIPANSAAFERALEYIHPMKMSEYVTYSETLRILTTEALEKMYNGTEPADVAWTAGSGVEPRDVARQTEYHGVALCRPVVARVSRVQPGADRHVFHD